MTTAPPPTEPARMFLERFEAAFELSPAPMAITRLIDHAVLHANKALRLLLSLGDGPLHERTAVELGFNLLNEKREALYRKLEQEGRVDGFEIEATVPSGRLVCGVVSGEILNLEREPCVLWVFSDTTVRKSIERELRDLTAELHRRLDDRTSEILRRNEELEAFASSLTHDLRAPLRVIRGLTEILIREDGAAIGARGLDYVTRIGRAGRDLTELLDSLLALSQAGAAEMLPEEVDLGALAHECLQELMSHAPARTVTVSIDGGPAAYGDRRLLRILIMNLVSNAWKFTANRPDAFIRFRAERQGGSTWYVLEDNGIGFPPDYAERIFRPFERLHPASDFPGSGVGLATVDRIVRRMHGEIRAESGGVDGAVIRFTLPRP